MESSKAIKDNTLDTTSGIIEYVNNPSEETVRTDLDDRFSVSAHSPNNDFSGTIGSVNTIIGSKDLYNVEYVNMVSTSRIIRVEDIPLPSDNENTIDKNTEVLQSSLLDYSSTDSEMPKIDKMDVDEDDIMSDVNEDDKKSYVDEDDKKSYVDEGDKKSYVDEDDNKSSVDEDDKKSYVDEDDNKSSVDEDDNKSDVDEDDKQSDVHEDNKKSDVDEDNKKSDVDENDKNSDVDEDDKKSDKGAIVVSEDSVSSVKDDDSFPVEADVTNSNMEVPESQSDIIKETQEYTQSENKTMDTDEHNLEKPEDAWELRTKEDEKESFSYKTLDTGNEDIATGTESDESISEMSGTAIETETDKSAKETEESESILKEENNSDTDEELEEEKDDNSAKETEESNSILKEGKQSDTEEEEQEEEKDDIPSDVPESHTEETDTSTELSEEQVEEIQKSNDDTQSTNQIDEIVQIESEKETLEIQSDEDETFQASEQVSDDVNEIPQPPLEVTDNVEEIFENSGDDAVSLVDTEEASEAQMETKEQCEETVDETSKTQSQPDDNTASKLQEEIKETESSIPFKEFESEQVSLDANQTPIDVEPMRLTPEMHSESGEEQTKSDEAQKALEKSIPDGEETESKLNNSTIEVDLTDTNSEPEELQIEEVTPPVEQLQPETQETQVDEEENAKCTSSQVEEVPTESADDTSKESAEVIEMDSIDQSEDDIEKDSAVQSESDTESVQKSENVNKSAEAENASGEDFSIPEKDDPLVEQPSSTTETELSAEDMDTTNASQPRSDDSANNKELDNDITSSEDAEKSPVVESKDVSDQNTVIDKTTKEPVVDNVVDRVSNEVEHESNPIFVHIDTDSEKSTNGKNTESTLLDIQDEDFQVSEPQEDPIASDDHTASMDDDVEDLAIPTDEPITGEQVDEGQGASEEMCIIPDTERIISQAEKDAAAGMIPLRDPSDSEAFSCDQSSDGISGDISLDKRKSSNIENYIVSLCTDENVNTCLQCCLPRKSKYSVIHNKSVSYVCDDGCLNNFKRRHGSKVIMSSEGDLRVKKLASGINNDNMVAKVIFRRKCAECLKKLTTNGMYLSWETMEYCNELCLSKYQKKVASNCSNCQVVVRNTCFGKYCVRFGYDIRQFCSGVCLEEYKKGLKVCTYCQKDMSSGGSDGFLAPVGDKGQFKDFCTQHCMEKYDVMSNNRSQVHKSGTKCSVCLNEKPITIEFEHNNKANLFCGEPCFVAFKFVNNITPAKCNMCKNYFDNKVLEQNSMFYDNAIHSFCSKSCQNIYIIGHRKIVPCSWCKVKKYNFDMIKRSSTLLMCSLNCLNLYQISVNAVHSKKTKCDHCEKILQPLYHLTMSDATMRNFCSYPCVMAFQNQFSKTPITLNEPDELSTPVPTGGPKKSKRAMVVKQPETASTELPTLPVISNVQSLATTNGPTTGSTRTIPNANSASSVSTSPPIVKTQIKQQIIIKPVPIPPQRNIGTLCKVNMQTKGVHCKPTTCNKEVQTDEVKDKTAIVPIPVPIYIPCPMWMYSMPFPMPFPFPLPVPVPIFIPTTRNSANGIMKEIKKIQVKIPTDPFEAELLMMAEMVAGDKKDDHTDSESEEDTAPPPEEATFSPEPVDASNTFGDDMLQMALKMATELGEPAVDLEGALTANTITASQGSEPAGGGVAVEESPEETPPIHHIMERQSVRGRKRPGRPPKSGGAVSKRGRRSSSQIEIPIMAPPQQPPPPSEPVEKPDANMCLKYTFGVNAWKQWVTTKNLELEKTSRRVKLFKPEILQLTADELNYSLCLFVKEVRKPNGQEYAPDTIYYLCLGIQQYLFENARIDNIFCDSYYEKFTDCLDDIARKFSVLYNDSHYIVTRVEEEHLWESKQLGAHSPHVLLSTLMFFNTKHFNLTTVSEHMQLSFSHIMKHWKRHSHNQPGTTKMAGSRNVLLRFYPPQTINTDSYQRKKKVYEQQENEENPLRCPVKLYEFYLSKCPESVKTRNDVFYLLPERSCVPDSPVWYSTMPLPKAALEKMLHRVKMVKEINVALLTS